MSSRGRAPPTYRKNIHDRIDEAHSDLQDIVRAYKDLKRYINAATQANKNMPLTKLSPNAQQRIWPKMQDLYNELVCSYIVAIIV
jgi:hypothetical protein